MKRVIRVDETIRRFIEIDAKDAEDAIVQGYKLYKSIRSNTLPDYEDDEDDPIIVDIQDVTDEPWINEPGIEKTTVV